MKKKTAAPKSSPNLKQKKLTFSPVAVPKIRDNIKVFQKFQKRGGHVCWGVVDVQSIM